MTYLDHNATTIPNPKVTENIAQYFQQPFNASSAHYYGRKAKNILESARKSVLNLLGSSGDDFGLIFTSSGTEANNFIINNFLHSEIFISAIEHPSIYNYTKNTDNVKVIKVRNNGIIDLEDLELKLANSSSKVKLVSVMSANNETGIIQPLEKIGEIAKKYNAYFHSDIIQSIGKSEINITKIGADFYSISAHKFGGIIGGAALIYKKNINIKPVMIGGGQEMGLRSGTENLAAIASMGQAADIIHNSIEDRIALLQELRNYFEERLQEEYPDILIVGKEEKRLANTSLIINTDHKSEIQVVGLDMRGIYISAGSACSSGRITSSRTLLNMGYSEQQAGCAIRISFGLNNNKEDIDKFLIAYKELNKRK